MKQKTQYLNYAGLLEFMHLDHNNTDLFLSHCGMQQCKPGHRFGHSPRPWMAAEHFGITLKNIIYGADRFLSSLLMKRIMFIRRT